MLEALLIVAGLVVFLVFLGYVFQRKLMYYPETVPRYEPYVEEDEGLREIWYTAGDGEEINGIYTPAGPDGTVVLLLHGNAGSLRSWKYLHAEIAALGVGVLTIDYRGYGKSTGSPDEKGLYHDGRGALAFLRSEGVPGDRVILFGKSLGTGVAVKLAGETKVAGVILESPYLSFEAVAHRIIPVLPVGAMLRDRYDSEAKIQDLNAPLLVTVGDRDTLIPAEESKTLFDKALEPKEFYVVANAGHNDIQHLGGEAYWEKLSQWMEGVGNQDDRGQDTERKSQPPNPKSQ